MSRRINILVFPFFVSPSIVRLFFFSRIDIAITYSSESCVNAAVHQSEGEAQRSDDETGCNLKITVAKGKQTQSAAVAGPCYI